MKSGLAVALFVSLAANIFLGGFVAGRMLAGPHGFMDGPGKFAAFSDHKKDGRKGPGRGAFFDGALMFPAIEALPPEKRELFKENFQRGDIFAVSAKIIFRDPKGRHEIPPNSITLRK